VAGRPQSIYEAQHVTTMLGLVEAGLGVAAVPALAMPAKDHPLLVSVPLVDPVVTRRVGLMRRKGRSLSPAALQLYEFFGEMRGRGKGMIAASRSSLPLWVGRAAEEPGRKPVSQRAVDDAIEATATELNPRTKPRKRRWSAPRPPLIAAKIVHWGCESTPTSNRSMASRAGVALLKRESSLLAILA
jgi:LysR substrate binding domain